MVDVVAEMLALDSRISSAMQSEYPQLLGWRMSTIAIRRTGPAPDDWRCDRSKRGQMRHARQYLARAVDIAARRISEAYGVGEGSAWASRHGLRASSYAEHRAESQVLASLRAICRNI